MGRIQKNVSRLKKIGHIPKTLKNGAILQNNKSH